MMPDREKVINELNDCLENQHIAFMDGVGDIYAVSEETIRNVIALLKEQKSIVESLKSDLHETLEVVSGRLNVVRCKDCRYGQYCTDGETTYQCFKWNSGEFGELHEQDWFCADGTK